MKTFRITVVETRRTSVYVEAKDKEEAARLLLEEGKNDAADWRIVDVSEDKN
jgi:hypothetical protein